MSVISAALLFTGLVLWHAGAWFLRVTYRELVEVSQLRRSARSHEAAARANALEAQQLLARVKA